MTDRSSLAANARARQATGFDRGIDGCAAETGALFDFCEIEISHVSTYEMPKRNRRVHADRV